MGLFDFIREVGAKLGIGSAEAAPGTLDLQHELQKHGLHVEGLELHVDGHTVKVKGKVADQATKEKVILALGNIVGIGRVEEEIEVAPGGLGTMATFYTVQKGDSLSAIAKKHYADAGKYMAIFEANKPMLADPDKIYPGQVLRIPAVSATS
jgi:nucleoid-associated protein YgaU